MRLGEQRDQLRLRPVRVLELIDQDVPEATGDRGPSRRRLAHEAQRERHLVAEIDESVGGQQVLIASERAGQLRLPAGVLAASRDRVTVRVVRWPPASAAASVASRSACAA